MAVYTEVPDDALDDFVAEYDIGSVLSYKGIAEGVENSNFLLTTSHGRFILTLYEKRVDPSDIPYFLKLMDYLAKRDIPCPSVLHGRDGKGLRKVCGKPAAIFSFLDGMSPRRIDVDHCRMVGEALAKMHIASLQFPMTRKNSLSLAAWRPLLYSCGQSIDQVQPGLRNFLEIELEYLHKNWPTYLPAGTCHADLFPDNVFFLRKKLSGLIDFYFACNDFLAYDLAICLNAWCFDEKGSIDLSRAHSLLTGYCSVRQLSVTELKAFPTLARGGAVRFLLTRLFDWINNPTDALVRPKNPSEYYYILSFHQKISEIAELGLE
ncbi:MAG: homoserine kinase [Pseudomonadota bacterium]|nr:homoserine kinase [Pseudomonadota bacterium]